MTNNNDNCWWLSFKGFMYAPLHHLTVAWSVHATNDEDAEGAATCDNNTLIYMFCRTFANITFNKISVNVGYVWSSATNEAIIPIKGLYYVTFVLFGSECHVEASLLVNESTMTSMVKTACGIRGYLITRERAVLLTLTERDKVTVKITTGTLATLRDQVLTSFAGILIYPL